MDWVTKMNEAVDYLESHLLDEVKSEEISRITACPFPAFQQMFSQVTGVSVSEYIRRRKLTRAAYDLQNTDAKVMDVALKYGYESADAFSVAFKRLQGVTPTMARRDNVKLTCYCRLNFQLTIKGIAKMDYRMVKRDSFTVLGKRRITPYGAGTWAIIKSDGSQEEMNRLCGHFYDLGLCFGFGEDGSNDYMCAVEWEGGEVPGLDTYTYPPATWLIFESNGAISEQVLIRTWCRINEEFLPQSKYQKCGLPTIEKFVVWNEEEDYGQVEIWIPVTEKAQEY